MSIEIFHPDNEFVKSEKPEYKKGEEADGTKVGKPQDGIRNLDSTSNNVLDNSVTSNFLNTRGTIDKIHSREALDNKSDHPTPEEILAELNGSFLGSPKGPKNSTEGGVQIVEGSTQVLESPISP